MRIAIVFALLALSIVPSTIQGATGYVGLYTSAERSTSAWCPFGESSWARIEMWVWFYPGTNGLIAAEFGLEYPSNVLPTVVTYNPLLYVILGEIPLGVSGAFQTCQTDWVWFCHQTFWVTSSVATMIRIVPHPAAGYGFVDVGTCEMGYPIESVTILSHLWINQPSVPMLTCKPPLEVVIRTESVSWGAIKSLF